MMRKYSLGMILFLTLILLTGCGILGPQEVTSQMGISIARRSTSLLTPTSAPVQLEDQEESSQASIPVSGDDSQDSSTADNQDVEGLQSPTPPPTISPSPTMEERGNSKDSQSDVSDSQPCEPSLNRSFESEVIKLINQAREKEGLPPFTEQALLTDSARLHSQDMACHGFFSHTSPREGDVAARLALQGYQYTAIGENIAAGFITPARVVQGWMDSPGHRANIMSRTFTQIGVGYTFLEGSELGIYWTLLVGTP